VIAQDASGCPNSTTAAGHVAGSCLMPSLSAETSSRISHEGLAALGSDVEFVRRLSFAG
jgi:hypothetical protein